MLHGEGLAGSVSGEVMVRIPRAMNAVSNDDEAYHWYQLNSSEFFWPLGLPIRSRLGPEMDVYLWSREKELRGAS
jgi:hypothetical protein